MNELRQVKYEMFIKDVNGKIEKQITGDWNFLRKSAMAIASASYMNNQESIGNTSLLTIYDFDKLNDLAKIVVLNSKLFISGIEDEYKNIWAEKYCDKSQFKGVKDKIIAAKYLIKMCLLEQNRPEAYKFIFWALMVLTVDKTDAEEHLSLICDFAKMLGITEDEIEDIVHVIKIIYDDTDLHSDFKTILIPQIFGGVLKNGGNKEIDSCNDNVVNKESVKNTFRKASDQQGSQSTTPVDANIPIILRRK